MTKFIKADFNIMLNIDCVIRIYVEMNIAANGFETFAVYAVTCEGAVYRITSFSKQDGDDPEDMAVRYLHKITDVSLDD